METKDWILLIVPIICDGFVFFLLQKLISNRFDRINKKDDLRDSAVVGFWKKLQELNDLFITTNLKVSSGNQNILYGLETLRNKIFEIVQYYDTNNFDLKIFSKEYECWKASWDSFATMLVSIPNEPYPNKIEQRLGNALQHVKDNTIVLIETVRKKY